MSTYATVDDFTLYTALAVGDHEDLQATLDVAERDVDSILIPLAAGARQSNGLKLDPEALLDWQQAALRRATCAQGEYRLAMGADFFIRAQHTTVRGPDFSTSGQLPYIGPKVYRELTETGFVHADGIASIRVGSPTAPCLIPYQELLP